MFQNPGQWLKRSVVTTVVWLLPFVVTGLTHGQTVRAPDLGVWLIHQRDDDRSKALVVADVIEDGVFALAGLREGDRIVSINGRPIDRAPQFVQAFLSNHTISLVIARNGQQQTLALKSSAVMQGMVPLDPLYQAGFLVDESNSALLIVQRVFPGTPAFYAGLRQADVVTSVNDRPNSSLSELTKALRFGGNVTLVLSRNGQSRQMTLLGLGQGNRLRGTTTTSTFPPGAGLPPPLPVHRTPSAPLLIPPIIPSRMPAIPSPPPAIPSPPPPGAVPIRPQR